MLELIDRAVRAAHETEPSPLLVHVAGEFAERVARLWPSPHAAYFAASAARRHLVCTVLAVKGELAPADGDFALAAPLRAAVRALLPDAPDGLTRALGRLGETAWAAEDYRGLLALLAIGSAAKLLRHAQAIGPDVVRRLRLAPEALAKAPEALSGLNEDAIRLVVECHAVIRARDGAAAADAASARWARAPNGKALLALVSDDLLMEVPAPPHPGTALLRPLASKAAFHEKAREYQNCLASQTANAVSGCSAYYEWAEAPGAIVEISRDAVFGWRLSEARLAHNQPVPKGLRRRIVDELGLMGVQVGRESWELQHALGYAAIVPNFVLAPADQGVARLFEA
jgi:hypothetical protein